MSTMEQPIEPPVHRDARVFDPLVLENARLRRQLRERTHELDSSRARIVQAADAERRQLERNLHDGAQQRLVALSLGLRKLVGRLGPDHEAEAILVAALDELRASLGELRELASGLHPAVLCNHGLAVALESLAARAPVPVELTVELDEAADDTVELAAYYVVAEALTNVAKYACAATAGVAVASSGGTLRVTIADDGVGGANPCAGSGIRGLADRVESLGGRLEISSPVGAGTTLVATIPTAAPKPARGC
jgi:signal transduction histidine kinase